MSVEVVAEIGINHDGSVRAAEELIHASKEIGADTVKFQLYEPALLTSSDDPLYDTLVSCHLTIDQILSLRELCSELDIGFLCTPFDIWSMLDLRRSGVDRVKIASPDIVDAPLLYAIGCSRPREIILSTGTAKMEEVRAALGMLALGYAKHDLFEAVRRESIWRVLGNALIDDDLMRPILDRVILAQCTSAYPAQPRDANVWVLDTYSKVFGTRVGFSDHTRSTTLPMLAVALEACYVEKHLTYSCSASGPDHAASLEIPEFKAMVDNVREAEEALGSGVKDSSPEEESTRQRFRKKLVATQSIDRDTLILEERITRRRTGSDDGLSPFLYWSMVGQTAMRDIEAGEVL